MQLAPGAGEALARLQSLGLRLAIVTNQQGIGLGYFTLDDFIAVNQALLRQLAPHGVKISKIYFCPHSLADGCACRKPGTRLLERALQDFGFPAKRAFLIGDSSLDFDAGRRTGRAVVPRERRRRGVLAGGGRLDCARRRALVLSRARQRSPPVFR